MKDLQLASFPKQSHPVSWGFVLLLGAFLSVSFTALWFSVAFLLPKAAHLVKQTGAILPPMAEVVAQWQRLAAAAIPLMLVSGAALIVLCISAVPAQLRRILAVFLSLIAIGSAAFAGWCFTAAFLGADMSAAVQTGRVRVYERALEAEGLLASARNEFAAFDEKYRAMRQLRPVPITDVATLSTPDKRDRADALIAALKSSKDEVITKRLLATLLLFRSIKISRSQVEVVLEKAREVTGQSFKSLNSFYEWLERNKGQDGWTPIPLFRFSSE